MTGWTDEGVGAARHQRQNDRGGEKKPHHDFITPLNDRLQSLEAARTSSLQSFLHWERIGGASMDMYLFYDLASATGLAHGIRSSCLLEQYPRLRKIYIDVIEGKIRSSYRRFTSSRYNPETVK